MACPDNKIRELIVDYIDGNLDLSSSDMVAEHLDTCPECRTLENEYRTTIEDLKRALQEASKEHASNEVLVEFIDDPQALAAEDRETLELHLSVCSPCEQKADMLRSVAAELSNQRPARIPGQLKAASETLIRSLFSRPIVRVAAAAVLMIALSVSYLVTIEQDRGQGIHFTSSTDVVWLSESVRSEQSRPTVRERNGRISIGMKFNAFFDEESYKVELRSADNTVLQQASIRKDNYHDSGVRISVETSSLDSGAFKFTLTKCRLLDEDFCLYVAYPFQLAKE